MSRPKLWRHYLQMKTLLLVLLTKGFRGSLVLLSAALTSRVHVTEFARLAVSAFPLVQRIVVDADDLFLRRRHWTRLRRRRLAVLSLRRGKRPRPVLGLRGRGRLIVGRVVTLVRRALLLWSEG